VISHLDPAHLKAVGEVGDRLRGLFGTTNRLTNATPGTGSSGMEACVAGLLEPGDAVLCCVHGYFGDRIRQMAERQDADVTVLETDWGQPTDANRVAEALKQKAYKVVTIVHAETSTGVLQPMEDVAAVVRDHGAMLVLDAVTSLGGLDVQIDAWGVDAAYSCSQKCIGSPSGLAPVSFSDRAVDHMRGRTHPIRTWYLDAGLLDNYWNNKAYHHTSSSTLNFALLEALHLIDEEGLAARIARHRRNHLALVAGVEAMGLSMRVAAEHRLPCLNAISIPDGVDEAKVRGTLLERFNLEIGAGLGAFKGQVWRVGLMGYSSSPQKILFFLSAMHHALSIQGTRTDLSAGVGAAMDAL
jgi:alanine-glyoxylate transaminase/serine-glyoxylate transaminase/serine-pyruvate transaminase